LSKYVSVAGINGDIIQGDPIDLIGHNDTQLTDMETGNEYQTEDPNYPQHPNPLTGKKFYSGKVGQRYED